ACAHPQNWSPARTGSLSKCRHATTPRCTCARRPLSSACGIDAVPRGATMTTQPWYRQPWPWFLMALPAVAVVGSTISAVIAVRTQDEVVERDYYRRGLEINHALAKGERAVALGVHAAVASSGQPGNGLALHVTSREPIPAEATLRGYLLERGVAS